MTVRVSKSIIQKHHHKHEAHEFPDTAIVEFELDHNDPMKRETIQISIHEDGVLEIRGDHNLVIELQSGNTFFVQRREIK